MSGTTMSTPKSSASGNIRPASITMMSSPQRTAMQFMPNSPRPPSGTRWSFPEGMKGTLDRSTAFEAARGAGRRGKIGRLLVLGCWLLTANSCDFGSMSSDKSWLRRRIEKSLSKALWRAYRTVRVDPERFLMELRPAHGLPVGSFQGMYSVEPPVLDTVAEKVIHGAMKMAAADGAGFGLGRLLTIVPDFSNLAGITMRTIQ